MSKASSDIRNLSAEKKRELLAQLIERKRQVAHAFDPLDVSVHRLFEAQANKTPENIAVAFEGQTCTYAELNRQANALAAKLRLLGVGPEVVVGICAERGIGMVVGLLGILKTGGAYLPLDPAFPAGRIAFMLEDAGVPVLLSQKSLSARFADQAATILCIDEQSHNGSTASIETTSHRVNSHSLAYVIYTSGSTGQPKGVMITHRALTNFLFSMRERPGFSENDTLLAVTTLSFDIAAIELFLPLIVGGRVEIVSRDVAMDGVLLTDAIKASRASVLQATPASWRLLLESGWEGSPGLRMFCGGEALTRDLADRLSEKGQDLWNLYGPTETTIWSTLTRVEPGQSSVPIGRPIANTRAYVLDHRLRLVPVGVVGELYLGGEGLARGYHARRGLTAERFLPDPHSPIPGARMYRTGDLARFRPDGSLECLGRSDGQVKIRGYRVELGDVESALAGFSDLSGAAVVARDDSSGAKHLVAYVVMRMFCNLIESDIRAWLKDRLPEYMIPSIFVPLNELPLTPNGKVDRKALPDPNFASAGRDHRQFIAPRGPIEEAVAAIWRDLLRRERISIYENFFELGGHSLMAAQLITRVREMFSVELPLRTLFENATVAGLAQEVEIAVRSGAGLVLPPLLRGSRDKPIPASYAQQRLWFLDRLEPGRTSYNLPVAVRLIGVLDRDALEKSLKEVVRRHESLRTTFREIHGEPFQVVAPDYDVVITFIDLTTTSIDKREKKALSIAVTDAWKPFDLANGPLFRILLIKISETDHIVAITIHHIVSDAWSNSVLTREIGSLYEVFRQGLGTSLPELPVQVADHAIWQRDWLSGATLEAETRYWKEVLRGVPSLELPSDRKRPLAPSGRGGECTYSYPKTLVNSLKTIGRKDGATLFMSLLALFETLLYRYTGQVDFAVGSPIAGRTPSQTEGLIGLFVNTLVFRANFQGNPSFRQVLRRLRQTALGAFAHQDVPFDQVVKAVDLERDHARTPLIRAMFVLQNAPMPALAGSELTMTPITFESVSSKFDLTMSMIESDEGLEAILEYDCDLFDRSTVERMLHHFHQLFEAVVADPDRPVCALPMLSAAEQRSLLKWDDPEEESENPEEIFNDELEHLSEGELDALINGM